MIERATRAGLDVAMPLAEFVEREGLQGTGIDAEDFWSGLAAILRDLGPRNRELLAVRDSLQSQIDAYHRERPGVPDPEHYRDFLTRIGYLLPEPEDFEITTSGVDTEIRSQAGPQLVVPLLNARFAVNAANARWGSLYDALYGTDAISDTGALARGDDYNALRGAEAIARGRALLDLSAPLASNSHAHATAYRIDDGTLRVILSDGEVTELVDRHALIGYRGDPSRPTSVLLRRNGLHLEVLFDSHGAVGAADAAGIDDIMLESAVTTIMDLEDSVAAVDADDKVLGYHNWRELMKGTLTAQVVKGGREVTRRQNGNREYTSPAGEPIELPGRSLLLIRNVGHLMTTDAVVDADGRETPEGVLDAVMTTLGALADGTGADGVRNSRTGSVYIVKPKMHGPEEVAFTVELFRRVESLLGLAPLSIKVGIMDEERRTTLNLKACIAEAADRVVFINTGFLDRTGDEIHTSMAAGPVVRKADMRSSIFLDAYERSNVATGLRVGFAGRAQIGKGMWAMPDLMHDMLVQKEAHVRSGATAAWVPSPTAATLHSLHYRHIDAFAMQAEVAAGPAPGRDPILVVPLGEAPLTADEIATEVDSNVQSILGYVVRWVDHGIGCSKVPDIHDVALMEDRATLRISSQLLSNWLAHGVITNADVDSSLERLSPVVDAQNSGDAAYEPLIGADGPGLAYRAARSLIMDGAAQPNGYTEPILHRVRREKKAHG